MTFLNPLYTELFGRKSRNAIFFKTRGHLSGLIWPTQCDVLSCLVLFCKKKITSHKHLLGTLIVIELYNILVIICTCICTLCKSLFIFSLQIKKNKGKARRNKTRQGQQDVPWFWKTLYLWCIKLLLIKKKKINNFKLIRSKFLESAPKKDKTVFHNEDHIWWCPGDTRNHGKIRHSTDLLHWDIQDQHGYAGDLVDTSVSRIQWKFHFAFVQIVANKWLLGPVSKILKSDGLKFA